MSDLYLWLSLLFNPHLSLKVFYKLLAQFSSVENIFSASITALKDMGLNDKQIATFKKPSREVRDKITAELNWENDQRKIITFIDSNYPPRLKEIAVPPPVLYVEGNLAALSSLQIAIVGSRKASTYGLYNAELFAASLATAGCVISSGLALGIDAAAHRGAIRIAAPTIAVMGRGLRHIYPASHHNLAQDILRHAGALVSEFTLDTPPRPHHFPQRNRIISGMSHGVLVVEAALKSGSLITARLALEQNRDIYALPGNIHQPLAAGCHALIQDGAKLVTGAQDILSEILGEQQSATSIQPKACAPFAQHLSQDATAVLQAIDYEMTPIDVIVSRTGLTLAVISSILLTLELGGFLNVSAGEYTRIDTSI